MHTQRCSMAAIAGYSSLSIIFCRTSRPSTSLPRGLEIRPGVTKVARLSRETIVDHQLVVDKVVRRPRIHRFFAQPPGRVPTP